MHKFYSLKGALSFLDTGAYILIGMLILGFAAAVAIGVAVYKIKRKLREISKTAFGIDDFIEGYKKQETKLSNMTRSVSGMTNVLLPSIVRDFPEFNYEQAKSRSEMFVKAYLNSIEKQDISSLKAEQISQNVQQKTQEIINDIISQNRHIVYDKVFINQTEISNYKRYEGFCTIYFQSSVSCFHYCLDSNGNVIDGRKDIKYQTVFETSYTYIQDISKLNDAGDYSSISLSCPHCGAPIKKLGSKFCEYCGSGVKEINIYSWNFTDIKEINKSKSRIY